MAEEQNLPNEITETQDQPVYIPSAEYSKKYNIHKGTVHRWIHKGWVEAKTANDKLGRPRWLILDLPPPLHPQFSKKQPPPATTLGSGTGAAGYTKGRINKYISEEKTEKNIEQRKQKLRLTYLPLFEQNAPPGQMTFTARELMEMLGVNTITLYKTWPAWGLTRHILPISTETRGGDYTGTGQKEPTYYYTRAEIHRFLSGQWEAKGFKTTDDKVITSVMGGITTESGYYVYNPATIHPLDGHGVLNWIADKQLMREDKRLHKWVPFVPWDKQKEFIIEAFRRENNEYKHRLIVACWPRGESKTTIVAILAIFRFFNLFGEVINLSGNSKDQATFAHYDLIKKIILNTPSLAKTPGLVVKEKYIALLKGPSDPVCQIKAIPTSTGLLPGTTCAVFTELHKLEDREFFIDLWTSTRATPNAMVLVDTTVAKNGHIAHSLWETHKKGEDPYLFFHHYEDQIFNPETTPAQLASFKRHMLEQEYNKYFRNRWADAAGSVFSPKEIRRINYGGIV